MPVGVRLTHLENGLTVIVREDHSAPVVSAQAWCMAGSIHEGSWLGAGLSHVLEHMLFKGTTTRPGSRIDQEVQEAGGSMNAYTSFDRTVYHIDVPNSGARVAIDILCDIMQNATLPAEELEKEKQVILREMDMNVDDPGRRSSRRLFETAYTRSPYRFTIIGYPDLFNELRPEDIRGYYREKYAPGNVFFVIVGDVKADEVIAQIREGYAQTRGRPVPPSVVPEEPRQTGAREVIEEAAVELGFVHLAWHIPALRHPDVPVLDVLAALLGGGRSSRLYQAVREKLGLVHSVDAWTYSPGDAGLVGVSLALEPENFIAAREAVMAEIHQMKAGLVSDAELAKAVKQFIAGALAARKTMQGQAQDLGGSWLAANDLNFSQRYLETIKRVTAADLQRVACQYLTAENRTVFALLPTGTAPKAGNLVETTQAQSVERFTLDNGLTLLIKADHRLPFVDFRAVFKGGVLAETVANSGITQLNGRMLLKGTTRRTAEDIAREIESVGGSIDSYGGNNSFGVSLEVLREDFGLGLDVLSDVLLRPSFPESHLERERETQLAAIRAQRDHLLQCATKAMRREMFGEAGYGLDVLGTEETVRQFQAADLRAFHQSYAVPNNCVLAIYGDVQPDQVRAAVESALGAWPKSLLSAPQSRAGATLDSVKRVTEDRDKKQAVLVVGFRGSTLHSSDRYSLELLQEVCSDLGSRLFLRVREKLGLAYFVGAQNMSGLEPGYFAFYAGTTPEKAGLVEQELLSEAALLRAEGLSEQELRRAKAKVIGQRKISRQDLGSLAMATALDELYGLGYDHCETEDSAIESVTLGDIQSAARKYLRADAMVISVVNPS